IVTTQCLEVGADFSFTGLITECASLDALRQRFGRLNRLGTPDPVDAAVLVRRDQLAKGATDPIYGEALRETWEWLQTHAHKAGRGKHSIQRVDFGISAMDALLPEDETARRELMARLSAPVSSAPVLLPAYLDMWVQTWPVP